MFNDEDDVTYYSDIEDPQINLDTDGTIGSCKAYLKTQFVGGINRYKVIGVYLTDQLTSSNISASGYVSASFANFNTLTSVNNIFTDVTSSNISSSTLIANNNILVNVTSSNISASGYISGSNIYVENTITADTGSFIYFNINNTGSAPTNYTSSGMPGEVRFDNNFIYIYANNLWVRTPIVRWSD